MDIPTACELIGIPGLYDVLLNAVSDAVALGKKFVGILLDDGVGLVVLVNQIEEGIDGFLLMVPQDMKLDFCENLGLYQVTQGDMKEEFKVCRVKDYETAKKYFIQRRVIHYELIGGNLEDFLSEALGR